MFLSIILIKLFPLFTLLPFVLIVGNMVKNSSTTFVNARDSRPTAPREQRPRSTSSNAYSRTPTQVGFGSEQGNSGNFILQGIKFILYIYIHIFKLYVMH